MSSSENGGDKKHISLVVCGHVDAGKSTTTGHLIFKLGGISSREMEKLQAEADAQGKSSFAFAYYMDRNKQEREKGITIDCTTKEFYTDSYHYCCPWSQIILKYDMEQVVLIAAEAGGFEKGQKR